MEKKQFYYITAERCIACGRCALVCPESCIGVDVPYVIDQDKCVLCGTCFNVCPKGAVEKRESSAVLLRFHLCDILIQQVPVKL